MQFLEFVYKIKCLQKIFLQEDKDSVPEDNVSKLTNAMNVSGLIDVTSNNEQGNILFSVKNMFWFFISSIVTIIL